MNRAHFPQVIAAAHLLRRPVEECHVGSKESVKRETKILVQGYHRVTGFDLNQCSEKQLPELPRLLGKGRVPAEDGVAVAVEQQKCGRESGNLHILWNSVFVSRVVPCWERTGSSSFLTGVDSGKSVSLRRARRSGVPNDTPPGWLPRIRSERQEAGRA